MAPLYEPSEERKKLYGAATARMLIDPDVPYEEKRAAIVRRLEENRSEPYIDNWIDPDEVEDVEDVVTKIGEMTSALGKLKGQFSNDNMNRIDKAAKELRREADVLRDRKSELFLEWQRTKGDAMNWHPRRVRLVKRRPPTWKPDTTEATTPPELTEAEELEQLERISAIKRKKYMENNGW